MSNTAEYTRYVEKPVSPTLQSFAEWLAESTGYAVDERTVSLAIDLHATWQASPERKAARAAAAEARAAEDADREQRKAEREATRVARVAAAAIKAAAAKPAPTAKPAPRPSALTKAAK